MWTCFHREQVAHTHTHTKRDCRLMDGRCIKCRWSKRNECMAKFLIINYKVWLKQTDIRYMENVTATANNCSKLTFETIESFFLFYLLFVCCSCNSWRGVEKLEANEFVALVLNGPQWIVIGHHRHCRTYVTFLFMLDDATVGIVVIIIDEKWQA